MNWKSRGSLFIDYEYWIEKFDWLTAYKIPIGLERRLAHKRNARGPSAQGMYLPNCFICVGMICHDLCFVKLKPIHSSHTDGIFNMSEEYHWSPHHDKDWRAETQTGMNRVEKAE